MTSTSFALIALTIIVCAGVLWARAIQSVSIPQNRGLYLAAAASALVLAIAALSGNPGWLSGIAAGLALVASVFFLLTFAISAQKLSGNAIQVGDNIPVFDAVTAEGERFESSSLSGNPTLIKFFRGHW